MKQSKFFARIGALLLLGGMLTGALTGCKMPEAGHKLPYDYDLSPYVTLGQYRGITYKPMDTTVTEEQLEEEIKQFLT